MGLPAGFQGIYELFAVVTHKGRSADSGHYVAWIREFEGKLIVLVVLPLAVLELILLFRQLAFV